MFDAMTYNKGACVLHMLRGLIGDEAWWKGIRGYVAEHQLQVVETDDFRKAMEAASGKDLKWFFDQWVYKAGHPELKVRWRYEDDDKTVRVRIEQTQKVDDADAAVPPADDPGDRRGRRPRPDDPDRDRRRLAGVHHPGRDPAEDGARSTRKGWLIKQLDFEKIGRGEPLPARARHVRAGPAGGGRARWPASPAAGRRSPSALAARVEAGEEPSLARRQLVELMGNGDEAFRAALIEAARDPEARVRVAAIAGLARLKRDEQIGVDPPRRLGQLRRKPTAPAGRPCEGLVALEGRRRPEAARGRPEDPGRPPRDRRHGAGDPAGEPGLPRPRAGGDLQPVRPAHRPADHGPRRLPPAGQGRPGASGHPRQPDRRPGRGRSGTRPSAAVRELKLTRALPALRARLGHESSGFSAARAGSSRRRSRRCEGRQATAAAPTARPTRPRASPSSRPRPPSSRSRPATSAAGSPALKKSRDGPRRPPRDRPPARLVPLNRRIRPSPEDARHAGSNRDGEGDGPGVRRSPALVLGTAGLVGAVGGHVAARGPTAGWVVGIGGGYYLGCWLLEIRPRWPIREDLDRLLGLVIPAVLARRAAGALSRRVPRWLIWALRMAVAGLAARVAPARVDVPGRPPGPTRRPGRRPGVADPRLDRRGRGGGLGPPGTLSHGRAAGRLAADRPGDRDRRGVDDDHALRLPGGRPGRPAALGGGAGRRRSRRWRSRTLPGRSRRSASRVVGLCEPARHRPLLRRAADRSRRPPRSPPPCSPGSPSCRATAVAAVGPRACCASPSSGWWSPACWPTPPGGSSPGPAPPRLPAPASPRSRTITPLPAAERRPRSRAPTRASPRHKPLTSVAVWSMLNIGQTFSGGGSRHGLLGRFDPVAPGPVRPDRDDRGERADRPGRAMPPAIAGKPDAAEEEFFEIEGQAGAGGALPGMPRCGEIEGAVCGSTPAARCSRGATAARRSCRASPMRARLVEAIRYDGDVKMPPKEKLKDAEIAALTDWVRRGAHWPSSPRGQADRASAASAAPASSEILEQRPILLVAPAPRPSRAAPGPRGRLAERRRSTGSSWQRSRPAAWRRRRRPTGSRSSAGSPST